MIDTSELGRIVGSDVVDPSGKLIGRAEFVFNDPVAGQPEWIGVLSGTFRHQRTLVPIDGSDWANGSLQVPWPRERVKHAPTYGVRDRGGILGLGQYALAVSEAKERAANAHYGLGDRAPA